MQDILFDIDSNILGEDESTRSHQTDILLMHKGWNKFNPSSGVGVFNYVDDEDSAEDLRSSITHEYQRDGMKVNRVEFLGNGKINTDANY